MYELPLRAEDFDKGEFVCWRRAKHSTSGVQEHGYDLGAVTWIATDKAWSEEGMDAATYAAKKEKGTWANDDRPLYGSAVYAMRAGTVIAGWRNAPENPVGVHHAKVDEGYVYGGGNGLWIEHDDGTRAEYAHFIPGTVPSELCPHDDVYLPEKIESPKVKHAWPHILVPEAQRARVEQGQFIGRVGNTGTSSGTHLHVHVEKGGRADDVKSGGEPVEIRFNRGLAAQEAEVLDWASFAGSPIPPGPTTVVWPPSSLTAEYARHGQPIGEFNDLFLHLADSGYWLVLLDTYTVGGERYVNHLWRPREGEWRAHLLESGAKHQELSVKRADKGFWPVWVESSVVDGKVRFSAVFRKLPKTDLIMRHGISYEEHRKEYEAAKERGLSPVCVSPSPTANGLVYTVLYRPESIGRWDLKPRLPEAEYQAEYDRQKAEGRRPVYLGGYLNEGKPTLSVVFADKAFAENRARHGIDGAQYQQEWDAARKAGLLTRALTAIDGASSHRYAARWAT